MLIGPKTRRIVLQAPTEVVDAVGDVVPSWTTLATVWASIEPLRGEERYLAQQVQATVTHRIRIRWSATLSASLTPKCRATYGSRVFDIGSVADLQTQRRELELMVTERVP